MTGVSAQAGSAIRPWPPQTLGPPVSEREAAFAPAAPAGPPRFVPFVNNMRWPQKHDGVYALSGTPTWWRPAATEPVQQRAHRQRGVRHAAWLARFFDSMINMDDPRHSRIRKVVPGRFTPRLLAKLEVDCNAGPAASWSDVGTRVGRETWSPRSRSRLPSRSSATMMGIPEHQFDYVLERTNTIIGFSDPEYTGISRDYLVRHGAPGRRHIIPVSARLLKAGLDLIRLVRRLGEERTREPRTTDLAAGQRQPGTVIADRTGRRQFVHPARVPATRPLATSSRHTVQTRGPRSTPRAALGGLTERRDRVGLGAPGALLAEPAGTSLIRSRPALSSRG